MTVAICSRNRPEALLRCLRSLTLAEPLIAGAIVLDDGSLPPLPAGEGLAAGIPVRWLRNERGGGVAAGRNRLAREADTPFVLNLDDDAFLLDQEALRAAVAVLHADPAVGVVALAQTDGEGTPWPAHAQPAAASAPCSVATFTGYGHLIRRDAFLAVGGFLEALEINGEEKELSLRLLDAGYRVVYLPGARVGHVAAAAGRDPRRYLHQTVRNEVLGAAHGLPAPLGAALGVARLLRYFPMRRGWRIHDPGGFPALLREIGERLPGVLRARRPVRWSTLRRWRRLTAAPQPYEAP